MICFRDMTFCTAECENAACPRRWDAIKQSEATDWWGGDDAPIAFTDFSANCPEYIAATPGG